MSDNGHRRIRAVLFDLGGTLLDLRDYSAWTAAAEELGYAVDPDHLAHAYADAERAFDLPDLAREEAEAAYWGRILAGASGREVDVITGAKFHSAVRARNPAAEMFSDVRGCLEELKRDDRHLGVVSNSQGESWVRQRLREAGIALYFETVVSSGSVGVSKPDPRIFSIALEALRVKPQEAAFVGDRAEVDARGATRAGLIGVWLNREGTGFGDDPPEITSLSELPLHLRRVERARPGRRAR